MPYDYLCSSCNEFQLAHWKGQRSPWKLKDDLEHFKAYTLGKPIIMGRKTYESIGRPLPDRLNVVVSRTINEIDNLITVTSLKKAINEARIYCESHGQNEIVLIE